MFNKTKKIFIALIAVMFAAIAAVLCVNLTHKNSQSETAQAATNVVQVDGTTYTDFATGWNAAVGKTSSASSRVTVKLLANITATSGSFGTGAGFGDSVNANSTSGSVLVPANKYITLDLNNFKLDRGLTSATGYGYVIAVKGNLVLTDSSASKNGKITGGNFNGQGGGVYVNGGTFTMNGGTISGNKANYGGGVDVANNGTPSTFTMSGGTISGNTIKQSGGGVYVAYNSTFTMSGGTISGNTVSCDSYPGGGGVMNGGTFTMSGGTITDNTVTGTNARGGGVMNGGTFTMSGGTITDNSVTGTDAVGGGVDNSYDTFNLSGSATVTGNSCNSAPNNVYLGTIRSTGKSNIITITAKFTGTVGVTTKTTPTSDAPTVTLTSGWGSSTGKITSDNPAYAVGSASGEKVLMDKPPVVEVTANSTATQYNDFAAGWQAAVDASTATVKLLDGVDTAALTVASGKKITLDLNGKILDRGLTSATSSGHVINVTGNLILNDSSASKNGKITGGKTSSYGGGVYVNGGTFTMNSGTISGNTASYYGGGVYVSENSTFTMSGGTISSNTATNGGGGVYVYGGKFTMSGGTISGNTGTYGGGVHVTNSSIFTMSNGTISGNTATYYGGGVYVASSGTFNLSGSATVTGNKKGDNLNNVYLISGKTITVSGTFSGTVGVFNTGAVATGYTQADKPSAHFVPDNTANKCVYATDGTVTIAKEHTGDDDGSCTTAVTCKCGYVIKAAETSHAYGTYTSDGANGHTHTCTRKDCNQKETVAHTPADDDNDCTTAVTCTVCGYVTKAAETSHTYGEYVSDGANGHTHTCTREGCNQKETVAHTPADDDNDCTTAVTCTVCGYVTKAAEANHAYGEYVSDGESGHTHTCTHEGCTVTEKGAHSGGTATCVAQAECEVCGTEYGELAAHTLERHAAVAATCTAKGNIEYWSCSICEKNFKDEGGAEEVTEVATPKIAHTEVVDQAVAATCTQTGLTAGKHCSVCKAVLVAQEEIPMIAHTYDADTLLCVCGEVKPIYWWKDGDTLYISSDDGHGDSFTYGDFPSTEEPDTSAPWYSSFDESDINFVKVEGDVSPVSTAYWFNKFVNVKKIDLTALDTSRVTSMAYMFSWCSALGSDGNTDKSFGKGENASIKISDKFVMTNVTSMNSMFGVCETLTSVDMSNFDIAQIADLGSMFSGCSSLTTVDLSNAEISQTGNVERTMYFMFSGCSSLTNLNLTNFNTVNVTSMFCMFEGCQALATLDLSSFNTEQVNEMTSMFEGCSGLATLDLSNFNTANVTNTSCMFKGCSSLTTLDLSNFDTVNVTNMFSMFKGCQALTTLDISNFNTANVTNMSYMFEGCQALTTLDLSSFNTEKVLTDSYVYHMFAGCNALATITTPKAIGTAVLPLPCNYWTGTSFIDKITSDYVSTETEKITIKRHETHNIPEDSLIAAVEATCTEAGNYGYYTCTICGKHYDDVNGTNEITEVTIPAKGHNIPDSWYDDENGHYKMCQTCSGEFDRAEHNYVYTDNDDDSTHNITCSVCDLVDREEHYSTEWINDDTTQQHYKICTKCSAKFYYVEHSGGIATCTAKAKCEVCGAEYGELAAHNLERHAAVAATCTAEGNIEYWSCSVCKKNFKDVGGAEEVTEVATPMIAHTGGTATCIAKAKCEACGAEYGELVGHTLERHAAVAATCTAEGNIEYWSCLICEKNFSDEDGTVEVTEVATPMIEHTAGEWITDKEPTCTEKGAKHKECTVCHTKLENGEIPALGHAYGEWTVKTAATCTEEGVEERVCANDETHKETRPIAALGHTAGKWITDKEPTCTEKGAKHKECTVCHTKLENGEIPALGHAWGEWSVKTAATCTEEGVEERVCANDETHKETRPIAALGHTAGEWITDKEPTCTGKGAKHKECTVCHTKLENVEIPALGHAYGEWTVKTPATATEDGVEERVCANDEIHTETRPIPATGVTVEKVIVTVTGGSIDGADGTTVEVDTNGEVTVVAVEIEDKTFKGWSADGGATILSADMRYTFSATKDMNLVAVYENAKPVDPVDPAEPDGKKLSGGAIAGITISVVILLLIALYVTGLILYKKHIIDWKICKVIYFYVN